MRIGIIQFPGSNCERETKLAVRRACMEPVEFLWNEPKAKLASLDGYIIVGGFSYEDRSRAGIIAALDPVMQAIKIESEKGKPVLGICNGAQILVETGLVPGLENNKLAMALTENKRIAHNKVLGTGFYNAWIYMRLSSEYQRNAFTRHLTPADILHVPVAHAEGRFALTEALLAEIKIQGLNLFEYCDMSGQIDSNFPVNPNGSVANIAGISNKAGNVLALMPHPERTKNGDAIFRSMRDYIANHHFMTPRPLDYYPRPPVLKTYQATHENTCVVALSITDNQALTVENTLNRLGAPVQVLRFSYWEVDCASNEVFNTIKGSGELYNPRKEGEVKPVKAPNALTILVRPKEDMQGSATCQALKDHYKIQGVSDIKSGVIWQFIADQANISDLESLIFKTNIISNPYAHDCYQYQ